MLRLRPDVPGASYFAVALERAMLTWFEVEPGGRFERHAHDADQITMVLEGVLTFELDSGHEAHLSLHDRITYCGTSAWQRGQ